MAKELLSTIDKQCMKEFEPRKITVPALFHSRTHLHPAPANSGVPRGRVTSINRRPSLANPSLAALTGGESSKRGEDGRSHEGKAARGEKLRALTALSFVSVKKSDLTVKSVRISSHRQYGHIDGTTPAPPKYVNREVKKTVVGDKDVGASAGSEISFEYETLPESNPEYEVWLAHNQSLVAYITSTLSEEVLGGIDDDLTALELWSTLATTYSQISEARFLQLRRQFQDIKRGTRTVLEFLNKIKSVSDQLAAIGHPVSDKDKVQQALSGLGTKFDIFCIALEVLPVLPSFEDLKAKLFQHEASRVQ
ncbi:hypothetical protein EJ110_NYTH33182 [Nymphaea thermarum]|nr:hypothetical protein EJ110_NYTH33182 [Nymphaea thermarum]